MELVYVPAGTLRMGSVAGEADERPVHEVELDGFWIGKFEVTAAQYAAFLNRSSHAGRCGNCFWLRFAADSGHSWANGDVALLATLQLHTQQIQCPLL